MEVFTKRQYRKGFTLIELLVVIAIIAILAAILFPVFAQARSKAEQAVCLSNMKQMGLATMMYLQDYDGTFYPHRWNSGPGTNPMIPITGGANSPINGAATMKTFWISILQPYMKSLDIFKCPDNPNAWVGTNTDGVQCGGSDNNTNVGCGGVGYGGQNSYGHNDLWLSPANRYADNSSAVSVVNQAAVPRSIVLICDATYYGAGPDVANVTGHLINEAANGADLSYANYQSPFYQNYWKNIGNSKWSWNVQNGQWVDTPSAQALTDGASRHMGMVNCVFTDGHAKAIPYAQLIDNICYWATDQNAPHPNCN